MRRLFIIPLLIGLSACGGTDSRYRDTRMLERPPTLPVTKLDEAMDCCVDDAAIPEKSNRPGLGADIVEIVSSRPMTLIIKQPFDKAWNNIGLALNQSDVKITDQERKQGVYYVAYRPASIFGNWLGSFDDDAIYQLVVTQQDAGTQVTAALANTAEQDKSLQFESDIEEARADAEDLLYRLYETLRDDLITQ